MQKMVTIPYYREVLSRELEKRAARNPLYSLRSFARDLKVSPQRLSDLIRGRYGLSGVQATHLAAELGLGAREQICFIRSAEMLHSRSSAQRESARAEFEQHQGSFSTLSLDAFQVISDWYHYAILELTYVNGFKSDTPWIAKRLGINEVVAKQGIERLLRLGMLEQSRNGALKCVEDFVATPSGIPSEGLRKFHRQILEKAIAAIDLQSVKERELGSTVMAIEPSRISEAGEELRNFRRRFTKKYSTKTDKLEEVYCLSMQFFRLQEKV